MDSLNIERFFGSDSGPALVPMLATLALGFVLSLLLRWHYHHFGTTLSNRREFSAIFPFIVLIVTLVIAVVKSSLALSLGLVGALSIVRFRTPIKEPEELVYIFMAIAIGLGLGADQIAITAGCSLLILFLMAVFKRSHKKKSQNLYLSIHLEDREAKPTTVERLSQMIADTVNTCELRRVESEEKAVQAIYYIVAKDIKRIYALLEKIRATHPSAQISLIDQQRVPGA